MAGCLEHIIDTRLHIGPPVLTGKPIAKSLPQPMTNDINAATFISKTSI